jgi:alpha-maltose-1-phosphate synthase
MRTLFVNENIGGHATLHRALRTSLSPELAAQARFVDVPRPGLVRRAGSVSIPGLSSLDGDFQAPRAQWLHSLAGRRVIEAAIREQVPDVIHVFSQHAALAATDLLRRFPSVVSTDCSATQLATLIPQRRPGALTGSSAALARAAERRVFDAATLVVAQSEWAAASLRDTVRLDDEKLHVVRFGIVPLKVEHCRAPGLPELTFIGAQMDRKGGWRLLDLFRRHLRERAVLNLVTRDVVVPELGVNVYNGLVPGDERLEEILGRSRALVFPTDTDTYGFVILEGMSAGLPVVATRINAIPELVVDGTTGLLVPPHDDAALLRAIEALLDDEDHAARLGEAGRTRMLEQFDARHTTTALVDLLHEAVERHAVSNAAG